MCSTKEVDDRVRWQLSTIDGNFLLYLQNAKASYATYVCCCTFSSKTRLYNGLLTFYTISAPSRSSTPSAPHKRKEPLPDYPTSEYVTTNEISVTVDEALSCDSDFPASSHMLSSPSTLVCWIPTPRSYHRSSITQKA